MTVRTESRHFRKTLLAVIAALLLTACNNDTGPAAVHSAWAEGPVASAPPRPTPTANARLDIGNTRYLFVLQDHSEQELEALLRRADEVARTSLERFDQLDIALVIHGPSVRLFTDKRGNRELVDLAAKLDAFRVLDVKICRRSLAEEGIPASAVPSFIDPVPFAPDEIARLTTAGYVNL